MFVFHLPFKSYLLICLSGIFAKLAAIWRQLPQDQKVDRKFSKVVEEATIRLDRADELCEGEFTGVEDMKEMLVTVRRQLNGGTFYQDVSEQEMAAVVKAMKAELSTAYAPTGHWYYCQNGHPVSLPPLTESLQLTL